MSEAVETGTNYVRLKEAIPTVVNYEKLKDVAHAIAVEKGWWEEGLEDRDSEAVFANFHAEVSEAWEEYRNGRMEVWHAEGSEKPEGFWVEIADMLIRLADWDKACELTDRCTSDVWADDGGRIQCDLLLSERKKRGNLYSTFVNMLHEDLLGVGCNPVKTCEHVAEMEGIDLYDVVRRKLTYNLARPYRHGGKKA